MSDVGLTEEDLAAIKPFEPYKDDKDDDVLLLKMEMLRNRHKMNSIKQMDTNTNETTNTNMNTNPTITTNIQTNMNTINQSESLSDRESEKKVSHSTPSAKSLEIGSENTAFSNRRPINKTTHSPKLDHKPPQKETKGKKFSYFFISHFYCYYRYYCRREDFLT